MLDSNSQAEAGQQTHGAVYAGRDVVVSSVGCGQGGGRADGGGGADGGGRSCRRCGGLVSGTNGD